MFEIQGPFAGPGWRFLREAVSCRTRDNRVVNAALLGRGFAAAHARLVAKLQEFVTGDRFSTGNEAVPPEYKDLVDQYLRALSAGSRK